MAQRHQENVAFCLAIGRAIVSAPARSYDALLVLEHHFGHAVECLAGPKVPCTTRLHGM